MPDTEVFNVPAGTPLDVGLGFLANAVVIDNITSLWMYLPLLGRYIPPYAHAWAENLLGATQRAQIQWAAPPTMQQGATDANQVAQVTWLKEPITSPSAGVNVGQATLTSRYFGTFNAGGSSTTNAVFTVDSTVQAMVFTFRPTASGPLLPQSNVTIKLIGNGTAANPQPITYLQTTQALAVNVVPLAGVVEAKHAPPGQCTLTVVNNVGNGWIVEAYALYSPISQIVNPLPNSTWDVSDRAARLLGAISPAAASVWDVSDRAGRLLGIADVSDRAARLLGTVSPVAASTWDVSDRRTRLAGLTRRGSVGSSFESTSIFNVNVALPAGAATTNIINGIANTRVYVWGGRLTFDTAAATFFNLTDGVTILDNYNVGQFPGPYVLDFDGNFATGIGNPLALAGFAGGAASVARGYLLVTQS